MDQKPMTPNILQTIEQEMDTDIHPLLKKILDNIKTIGLTIGLIIVVVASYSGYTSYQDGQKSKASSALGSVLILQDAQARQQGLENFLTAGTDKKLHLAARLALAQTLMDQQQYLEADQVWQKIRENNDPAMKTIAGLGQAKALLAQEKYTEAVEILVALHNQAGSFFEGSIASTLVYAAEKAGQKELAISEYQKLKTMGGGNTAFFDYKINQLKTDS